MESDIITISMSNQRLFLEPIRYIISSFKLKITEIEVDEENIIQLSINGTLLNTMKDVLNEICRLVFESEAFLTSLPDSCQMYVQETHEKIFLRFFDQYEVICQNFLLNQPYDLNAILELLPAEKKKKFVTGNHFTPVDLLVYEILSIIEEKEWPQGHAYLNKYVDRIRATKNLQAYLMSPSHYLRQWTSNIKCRMYRNINKLKSNASLLSHFATIEGLLYAKQLKLENGESIEHPGVIPVSLLPTKHDKSEIESLIAKQESWGILIDKMARDFNWYSEKLEDLIRGDPFIAELFKIANKARESSFNPKKWFCIIRNDFMHNARDNSWLQVEFNNIAVGFCPMSDRTQRFHQNIKENILKEKYQAFDLSNYELAEEGLVKAFKAYGNPDATALIIVSDDFERNVFDQRMIQQLFVRNKIESLRLSFGDVLRNYKYDLSNGKLYVNNQEIGLVYFRHGYMPNHYLNEDYWKIREIIECSSAMKCPNVHHQLINFKIFQHLLAKPENLERFITEFGEQERIRENFALFYDLGSLEEFDASVRMVHQNPENFVLKPSREGGGNNYFSKEILTKLNELTLEERKTYCLMQKIEPNPRVGLFFRDNKVEVQPCEDEIGIYSYILSEPEKVISSRTGGILARSKKSSAYETGVSSGNGVIDSMEFV